MSKKGTRRRSKTLMTAEDFLKLFNGNKTHATFFLAWLENDRNSTKAYLSLHPEVTKQSARTLGSRMLAKVDFKLVLDSYDLGYERYLRVLDEGLNAKKVVGTPNDFVETEDHATRHKFHQTLGKLQGLEGSDATQINVAVKPILGGASIKGEDAQEAEVVSDYPKSESRGVDKTLNTGVVPPEKPKPASPEPVDPPKLKKSKVVNAKGEEVWATYRNPDGNWKDGKLPTDEAFGR